MPLNNDLMFCRCHIFNIIIAIIHHTFIKSNNTPDTGHTNPDSQNRPHGGISSPLPNKKQYLVRILESYVITDKAPEGCFYDIRWVTLGLGDYRRILEFHYASDTFSHRYLYFLSLPLPLLPCVFISFIALCLQNNDVSIIVSH